jgi:alpha-tubulin suppressor-like RCC1 family protein
MSKNNTDDKKTNINYVTSFRNLVKKLGDKDKIMTNEFENNSVLTVQFTKTTLFILLRNGIVLSYDLDTKKKDKRSYKERGLPREIKTPSKLVDLVCGKEHCLARGIDNKVYAWGSNSNGQLGLGREIKDTMDVPKEIKAEYFEVSYNFFD